MNKYESFVKKLIEDTRDSKIKWERTKKYQEFILNPELILRPYCTTIKNMEIYIAEHQYKFDRDFGVRSNVSKPEVYILKEKGFVKELDEDIVSIEYLQTLMETVVISVEKVDDDIDSYLNE